MPKKIISKEEYDQIEDRSAVAREFLENDRFQFIRDYFQDNLNYVEKSILNNEITDVEECVTITDKIKRTFFKPKKVQVDELVGQYKLIKKFFNDLNFYVNVKSDLDEATEKGEVIVETKV